MFVKSFQTGGKSECLKEIGVWAFSECTSLKSITLPESLEIIGERMLQGYKSLEDIKIPVEDGKVYGYYKAKVFEDI